MKSRLENEFLEVPISVACTTQSAIAYYSGGIAYIDATTGALTNASYTGGGCTAHASSSASYIYFDPSGKYAYGIYGSSVVSYSINANTGVLTDTGSTVAGSSITFDSTGKFAYVFMNGNGFVSGNVRTYNIDPSTGALTSTDSTVIADLVIFDPFSKFVYVIINGLDFLSPVSITPYSLSATGILTPSGTPITGGSYKTIYFDPTGKFAYVPQPIDMTTNTMTTSIYNVDALTGALTAAGAVVGMHPGSPVTFDPTGKFAYMWGGYGLPGGYGIYTYLTGSTAVTSGPFTGDTYNIVFKTTPSGTFAYVFGSNAVTLPNGMITNSLTTYSVDSVTGALTALGAADTGTSITFDPSGKFAYVTRPSLTTMDAYTVSSYSVNQTTGALTLQGAAVTVNTNLNPSIVFDLSGKFVYLSDSTNIITYSIDPDTGVLTATGSTVPGNSIFKIIPAQ